MTLFDSDTIRASFSRPAVILSIVLHILLVYVLLNEELLWAKLRLAAELPQMEVELVPEPPKPQPPKPPPAPKPEEAKPEPPKPQAAEPPPKPAPEPPPQPAPQRAAPLTPPQLVPGRLAERSSIPHPASRNGAGGTEHAPVMSTGPGITLVPKEQAKEGKHGSIGPEGPELTQSEQDVVLAQILKYWHVDFHSPEAHGLVLQGTFYIQADGTLMSPVNKNDPWDPGAVVEGYRNLGPPGTSYRRDAIDGFLLALRLCQPLQLPSGKGPWPRRIVIRFAFDSL
ncbi:hypothetical protein [Telmatospirillum siberiense]|uniref:Uncharacterized protein n=1 Tax=Telmatospirillum siberiense TaxID=382514 RepID=A0A2N3PPZ2_9PROT|nr:hypothetical protein [Telmatospirillum siberiense]PKU22470.1 hypothetical protein CWS72_21310 [Telmatospirillum siberiense]